MNRAQMQIHSNLVYVINGRVTEAMKDRLPKAFEGYHTTIFVIMTTVDKKINTIIYCSELEKSMMHCGS